MAAPMALVALVALEAGWLPAKLLRKSPTNAFHAVAYLLGLSYRFMWSPLVYVLLLSIVEMGPLHRRMGPRLRALTHVLLAVGVSLHAYLVMTTYQPFAESVVIAAAFAAACALLALASLTTRSGRTGWRKWASPIALTAVGIGAVAANHFVVRGMYAPFHVALAELNLALFGLAALHFSARDILWLPRPRWVRFCIATLGVLVLAGLPFAIFDSGKTARKYVRAKTNIGLAWTITDPDALERYRRRSRVKPLEEAEAIATFERYSGLPTLPPDFRLEDHDIVLITVDALRWDQTSLADPALETTPNLVEFAEDGAFLYTQAHSPSSTTLQSMSSILTMSPPMAAHLDIWKMTWAGRLRLSAVTAAELLKELGYATHWVGHDHQAVFTEKIIGIEQGFDSRALVPETGRGWTSRGADAQIAKVAIAKLEEIPLDQRMFAWFFFVSPHAPYVVHQHKKPKSTDLERYRQEVHNADRQIGRVLDTLRKQDRLDSSIVIITSDHGEEFGERGADRHAKSVYEEVTHVPLLIHVPGLEGTRVDTPTSGIYLFAWLLLHSEGPARDHVIDILRKRIGPLMQKTGGAVPMQLLGRDLNYSALLDGETKLIYDHRNEILEVYDLGRDPGETDDLSFSDPARAEAVEPLLESLLDVREYSRNFRLQPRKRAWAEKDEQWLEEKIDELGAVVPETDAVEVKAPKSTKSAKKKSKKLKKAVPRPISKPTRSGKSTKKKADPPAPRPDPSEVETAPGPEKKTDSP